MEGKGRGKKMSDEERREQKEANEWKEQSSAAGLAGLTVAEAVKGALFSSLFQDMPDPLDTVSNELVEINLTD